MRWSRTLIPTRKNDPADATIASHKLLVRAGFVRQLAAGIYDFLPLGWRSLHKAMTIVREEMDAAGAAEVFLPILQPIDLWDRTGRNAVYGPDMLRVIDRKDATNALAPTHEECVTELVAAYVNSHKHLPITLYQIQTKFRDEPRPRSGLLRVREFLMKDAYSFDKDEAGLDESYRAMFDAYVKIYKRCGIPAIPVEAESGAIGGSASHEFTVPCDAGEDIILSSDKGNFAANVEKCETGPRSWTFEGEPTGVLETIHTPGLPGIEAVGRFMKVKPKNMLKTLLFAVRGGTGETGTAFVIAVVRGDHEVNVAKLAKATTEAGFIGSGQTLDLDEQAARDAGFAVGFVGPHVVSHVPGPLPDGRGSQEADRAPASPDREGGVSDAGPETVLVVDPDAAQSGFWAAGANDTDYHVKHFNWRRELADALDDPSRVQVADIRNALAGDPSPLDDGGVLRESRGVEVGHVFKLGTRYSEKLDARFLDEHNTQQPIIMGCYGIGVGRILISAVETGHDERGIIWPTSLAPYEAVVTPVKYEGTVKAAADRMYGELRSAGVDVLLDDRDDRPGSKFADADLIGIPVRITVGDRGLEKGVVELKVRRTGETRDVPVGEAAAAVRAWVAENG